VWAKLDQAQFQPIEDSAMGGTQKVATVILHPAAHLLSDGWQLPFLWGVLADHILTLVGRQFDPRIPPVCPTVELA
jgi:hypothetical protein